MISCAAAAAAAKAANSTAHQVKSAGPLTGCSMGLQQALATITQPVRATIYACHPACPLGPVMGVAGAPCASSATMVGQLLQQVISAAHGE